MTELTQNELQTIAANFVRDSMRIGKRPDGKHDSVLIRYNSTDPSCVEFALKVEEECWRTGAHTLAISIAYSRERVKLAAKLEDSLSEMDPIGEALMETVDVSIFIGEYDDPDYTRGLEPRFKLTSPVRQRLREILDERKVRWAFFGWPIPGAAKAYGLPVSEFRRIFFNSLRQSFSNELRDITTYYHSRLKGADSVRITADDGTDLKLRIKGRPILVDDPVISAEDMAAGDVGLNLPCGEVFTAPLETEANGQIAFEKAAVPGFGNVQNLRLTFKDGKVVAAEADKNVEGFRKFLDSNTGEKDRIAELGIGCNPGAEYTGGSIIIDEKISGTIHIAIGNNTGTYHGTNKASSHLDMIKNMNHGKMTADGVIVMDGGKPAAAQ